METKVTKVRLYAERLDLTEAFEFTHAEKILRLRNSEWRIADGENFEWADNAIRKKTNRRRTEEVK